MPTAHLQLALTHPCIAEEWKAGAIAELKRRGAELRPMQSVDRRFPATQQVGFTRDPAGRYVFILQPEPPSANDVKSWLYHPRAHWRYQTYLRALGECFAPYAKDVHFDRPIEVEHTWRLPRQPRDEDSFGLSLKPVFDAMEAAGILKDDSLVRLKFGGQVAGGNGGKTARQLCLAIRVLDA